MDIFEIYKDQQGKYRWRLRAGKESKADIIAVPSKGYATRSECQRHIRLVKETALVAEVQGPVKGKSTKPVSPQKQNAPLQDAKAQSATAVFEIFRDPNSEYRWRLRGRLQDVTAILAISGDGFTPLAECKKQIALVRQRIRDADIEDPGEQGNQAPMGSFTVIPERGRALLQVHCDGSASHDPDGTITTYGWEFGDGEGGAGPLVDHTYAAAGTFQITLTVTDNKGGSHSTSKTIVIEPSPTLAVPRDVIALAEDRQVIIRWSAVPEAISYNLYWSTDEHVSKRNGTRIVDVAIPYTHTGLSNGTRYYYVVTAVKGNDESVESSRVAATPSLPSTLTPTVTFTISTALGEAPLQVRLEASASSVNDASNANGANNANSASNAGAIITYAWDFGDGQQGTGIAAEHTFETPGRYLITLTVKDHAGNMSSAQRAVKVTARAPVPPEPSSIAPLVNRSVASHIARTTEYLYTGKQAIQTDVAAGVIEPHRVAVLRGRVLGRRNPATSRLATNSLADMGKGESEESKKRLAETEPAETGFLAGVKISILREPGFGSTYTRGDGAFDLVVNGGGWLTVCYEKDGYLPVQRTVRVPWQEYAWLPEVAMIPAGKMTTINLGAANSGKNGAKKGGTKSEAAMQVAQSDPVHDQDGARQAVLLFPAGTQAELSMDQGTKEEKRALENLSVRVTEYTVGAQGPATMPSELPPNSAYTYAVEFTVDEALLAGNGKIRFSQPLIYYVDNFLKFPVGTIVPAGSYSHAQAVWTPSDNGRVIEITGAENGIAAIDVDGSGQAAKATTLQNLQISDAERRQLATLYKPGQTLWRVPIQHFSPWDLNWPFAPPSDAQNPQQPQSNNSDPDPEPCCITGSIIEVQNQVLGQSLEIAGTPYRLCYRSDRTLGRLDTRTLQIQLSGEKIPPSLKQIVLEVTIAGQQHTFSFPAAPNQVHTFSWDGQDAYGRALQGIQQTRVRLGYVYNAVYQEPAQLERSFAQFGGANNEMNRTRQELTLWQEWTTGLGTWDAHAQGLGGWSLNVHHVYDPIARILYKGDGQRHDGSQAIGPVISRLAGTGESGHEGDGGPATQATLYSPCGLATDAEGTVYVVDSTAGHVRIVTPDNRITDWIGSSLAAEPVIEQPLNHPFHMTVGPDGRHYLADQANHRILRIEPDNSVTTVAGRGGHESFDGKYSGDGGLATKAHLNRPSGITMAADGVLYIADADNNRVRRVGLDGVITTVAGTGREGYSGDGGPATKARLKRPRAVALGPEGSLYIADDDNHLIRRVGRDGIITTVAGKYVEPDLINMGNGGFGDDYIPATESELSHPSGISVGADGTLYIACSGSHCVRRVSPDGIITTLAGLGSETTASGPAITSKLSTPEDVALAQDGSLLVADSGDCCVYRIAPAFSGFSINEIVIADRDGSQLYVFDPTGRHLRTQRALTGTLLYSFEYDVNGYLSSIKNGDNQITCIARDSHGTPTAIGEPHGQQTLLKLHQSGYLAQLSNPVNASYQFSYLANGLLTALTDPLGQQSRYTYDELGRLARHENPVGGGTTFIRATTAHGFRVNTISLSPVSPLASETIYTIERHSNGQKQYKNQCCGGTSTTMRIGADGTRTVDYPDGTTSVQKVQPDPRFGMQSPLLLEAELRTPKGLHAHSALKQTMKRAGNRAGDGNRMRPEEVRSLTQLLQINGRKYSRQFIADSRQIISTSPEKRQTVIQLDDRERVLQVNIAGLAAVFFTYDAKGKLHTIARGEGAEQRIYVLNYDAQGYLVELIDPLGQKVGFVRDALGQILKQTLPDQREVHYEYDASGNLVTLIPPGRAAHRFKYTPLNALAEYASPEITGAANTTATNDTVRFDYSTQQQFMRIAPGDEASALEAIGFTYDDNGLLKTIEIAQGKLENDYNNQTGQLVKITAPGDISISYEYDGFLLTGETWSGAIKGVIRRTYNKDLRLAQLHINDATPIEFRYDKDGLLIQAGDLVLTTIPESGLYSSLKLGQLIVNYQWNGFGEIVGYQALWNNSQLLQVDYVRDKLGRITKKIERIEKAAYEVTYTYDQVGNLVEITPSRNPAERYRYDENNNRLACEHGGRVLSGAYDAQDRMVQYGDYNYGYSGQGMLKSKTEKQTGKQTTYEYDALGNLRAVGMPDGIRIEYLIDGMNRRVGKKLNGVFAQGFLYQNLLNPIAELDAHGRIVARFVYASQSHVPDLIIKDEKTYLVVMDHVGSPRLVVDSSNGQVVQCLNYNAFGQVISDTNPGFQPFGLAGGLYDSHTELTRFGVRDYDAHTGRWTAKDPLLFAGGSENVYIYAGNDPINQIDPRGMEYDINNASARAKALADAFGKGDLKNINQDKLNALPKEWLKYYEEVARQQIARGVDACNQGHRLAAVKRAIAYQIARAALEAQALKAAPATRGLAMQALRLGGVVGLIAAAAALGVGIGTAIGNAPAPGMDGQTLYDAWSDLLYEYAPGMCGATAH